MEKIKYSIPEAERQELVDRIISDPRFSHGVFGRFEFNVSGGHLLQEKIGPNKSIVEKLLKYETYYEPAFGNHVGGIEFRVRTMSLSTADGQHTFIISFNDRRGDNRPASHTDYTLVIPESETELLKNIFLDHSILIDVFKKKFPRYDRSDGRLVIDPEMPEIIE